MKFCYLLWCVVAFLIVLLLVRKQQKYCVLLTETLDGAIEDTLKRMRFKKEHKGGDLYEIGMKGVKLGIFPHPYLQSSRIIKPLPSQIFFSEKEIPEMKILRDNYPVILEELKQLIDIGKRTFRDVPDPIYRKNMWKQFLLYDSGEKQIENCAKCPKTTKIIEKMNNATSLDTVSVIGFSNIYPGTKLVPHTGRSNDRVRIHLGLIVPEDCFIEIADQRKYWKEGEVFAFADAFVHSVQNNSNQNRYIFICDIWNPHLTKEQREFEKENFTTMKEIKTKESQKNLTEEDLELLSALSW